MRRYFESFLVMDLVIYSHFHRSKLQVNLFGFQLFGFQSVKCRNEKIRCLHRKPIEVEVD